MMRCKGKGGKRGLDPCDFAALDQRDEVARDELQLGSLFYFISLGLFLFRF